MQKSGKVEIICETCGKKFFNYLSQKKRFCSHECYSISLIGNIPWNKGIKTGLDGYWKGKKRLKETIEKARKTRIAKKYTPWNKGRKMSKEFCQKMSESNRRRVGPFSGNWKGGITPIYRMIRNSETYLLWQKTVLERDSYKCVKCFSSNKLNVHHISPFLWIVLTHDITSMEEALNCEELWDLKNGETLCFDCHKKTSTFGSKASNHEITQVLRPMGKCLSRAVKLANGGDAVALGDLRIVREMLSEWVGGLDKYGS